MSFENKIARIMRNTGPARFFVPVGLILIVFGVLTLRSESGSVDAVSMLMLAAGIAAVVFGTLKTVRAFRESGKLDAAVPNGGAFRRRSRDSRISPRSRSTISASTGIPSSPATSLRMRTNSRSLKAKC